MKINSQMFMVENPSGKRPITCHICEWENTIETNFKKKGWKGVDWIHLD